MSKHARILGALMMREINTRYGREGLGFLWLIGEPLLFCLAVITMWTAIKPAYEHGVRIGPFVMTGYMCLLMLRHLIVHSLGAISANIGLLHHRQVTILHIYISRAILEIAGTTVAFIVVYAMLFFMGQVHLPKNILLLYSGWLQLAWVATGIALMLSALATRFETIERITQLFTYLLIPLSGAFYMASAIPPAFRDAYLLVPMPNTVEMVRAGIFGEFVETHYHPVYALLCGTVLMFFALIMVALSRDYIDIE